MEDIKESKALVLEDQVDSKLTTIEDEMDEIKTNLINAADMGDNALRELMQLAKASQNPDFYEQFSKLLVAVSKINKEAQIALKEKHDIISAGSQPQKTDAPAGNTTNNNMIVTTSDLLDMIESAKQ